MVAAPLQRRESVVRACLIHKDAAERQAEHHYGETDQTKSEGAIARALRRRKLGSANHNAIGIP